MTQYRPVTAGEDGGHPSGLPGQDAVTHCKHRGMDSVQAPDTQASVNPILAKAEGP